MDVSIIIVNYKTPQLVIDCIESIYAQTKQYSFEIIVVDNDSQDDSKQKICSAHKDVIWIDMGYNSGFARGNNAGIKIAKGNFILLLNGDTIIKDGAIDKSINLLLQQPNAAACGVQLLNEDGSAQISGAYTVKGGLNTLLPIPYLGQFIRWLGYSLKSKIPSVSKVTTNIKVDWIIGAYMLVKKEVIEKAGLLDEDFFMYSEEMEWCSRLKKQGDLFLFAEPKVIHLGGGSSSNTYGETKWDNSKDLWSKKAKQIMVSNIVRIRKEFGLFWYFVVQGVYFFAIPIFFIGLIIEKIITLGKARYTWQQFVGYCHNVLTMLSYFFTISFNKPNFYKIL
jgi:GT2 family glycosyltransferase